MQLLTAAVAACGRDDVVVAPSLLTPEALAGIVDAADLHRVSGSAALGLRSVAGVPDTITDELAAVRRRNARRHLVVVRSLAEVGPALDQVGVRWAVIKGPVVASLLYRDAGARAYGDLDLLIHPADIESATRALEEHGFEHQIHNWPLARQFAAGEFSMRGETVELDVHWHVLYAWYDRQHVDIDLDAVFERVRTVDVSGCAVPTLDPVDTLWFLALHASKSGGHRLIWLKDIERSLAVDTPDLDELVRRSLASRCGPRVGVPLSRAAMLLAAQVPDHVTRELLGSVTLRALDRGVQAVSPSVRIDERGTLARLWNRSLRGSAGATAVDVGRRTVRVVREAGARVPGGEDDDQHEKRRYLQEVASAWGERS